MWSSTSGDTIAENNLEKIKGIDISKLKFRFLESPGLSQEQLWALNDRDLGS